MKTWQRVQLGSVLAAIDFDLEGLFGLDYVVLQNRCTSTVGRVNEIQTAENLKSNSASAKLFFIERRRVEREARTGGVKMKKNTATTRIRKIYLVLCHSPRGPAVFY